MIAPGEARTPNLLILSHKADPPDGRERIAELRSYLAEIDGLIAYKRTAFLTLCQITGIKSDDPDLHNCRLLIWAHADPQYAFFCQKLPPNLTKTTGFKCPVCTRTVMRTKREMARS
jgi:hypothetical protein